MWWCGWWCGDVVVWWCGGVFVVVVWWCQHPARELACFGVLHLCGGVVVWWFGGVWDVYMLNKDVLVRVWCVVILVNNSLIPKMPWSVVSRPFNRHVTNSPITNMFMVLSRPFRKHQMWSVVSRRVSSCDACVSVISCVYVHWFRMAPRTEKDTSRHDSQTQHCIFKVFLQERIVLTQKQTPTQ